MATHDIQKPINDLVRHLSWLLHVSASLLVMDCTNGSFVKPTSGFIQDTEVTHAPTGHIPSIRYPTVTKATLQSSSMQAHIQDIVEMDRSLSLTSHEAVATMKCTLAQTILSQDPQSDP